MRETPKVIKYFIFATCILSILSGICNQIFPSLLPFLLIQLCLTVKGITSGYIWQLLTHQFIYPAFGGIQPFFIINLALSMLILWRIGTAVCLHKGTKHFAALYLLSGLASGIAAFFTLQHLGSSHFFCGSSAAGFGLLTAAILLYPKMELMLFLTIPVKAKWLILAILSSILLIDFSNGSYLSFFTNLSSFITGYLYAVIAWRIHSPFTTLHGVEKILLALTKFTEKAPQNSSLYSYAKKSKIYDFHTGNILLDDETFIDACLEKISTEGRQSLTLREKFRLWKINIKRRTIEKKRSNYKQYRDQ